ncbi:MAG: hypothetical protein QNL19_07700 [Bacteroidota bacterium]|jgi:opacity protein-like surface antigen
MKKILTIILTLFTSSILAQTQAKIPRGSIGIGLHVACPQSELKDIDYDPGFGINFSYLTRGYPYKSKVNFQVGARMDFANMQSRTFDSIAVAQPADGPAIVGDANVKASNRMYGFFGLVRLNWGTQDDKFVPYLDLLAGHRNYNTYQNISLNEPEDNLDYESNTLTDKVVYTQRFHYGAGIGTKYNLNSSISLDAGITYTFGERGAALPLDNITRSEGGDEIDYTNYGTIKTDMLLINAGIRINLFKIYTHKKSYTPSTTTTPTNTRYKDTTPTKTSDPSIPNKNTPTKATPKKKIPIKIKPNGPTKNKDDRS